MNLDELKKGQAVVLDANIFLYASYGHSAQCARLIERCFRRELHGVFPMHVVAEINHRLMCSEARHAHGGSFSNPAKQLSSKPQKVKELAGSRKIVRDILAGDMEIAPLVVDDMEVALDIQAKHGLLTNDALLVAVAARLNLDRLASSDGSFKAVPGLQLYSPSDLKA